jgi:hypothetical protein
MVMRENGKSFLKDYIGSELSGYVRRPTSHNTHDRERTRERAIELRAAGTVMQTIDAGTSCVCVCVCVCVCFMCVRVHMRACLWRPEVHPECQFSGMSTLFCETGFLTGLRLTDSAWLTGRP